MNILFVGAFRSTLSDGKSGGQTFACTSLLSALRERGALVDTIDSSLESITQRGLLRRILSAALRISTLIYKLITKRYEFLYLFSSSGPSFVEKSIMARIGHILRVKPVMFPRSGAMAGQITTSRFMRIVAASTFSRCHLVVCQSVWWEKFYTTQLGPFNSIVVENWIPAALEHAANDTLVRFERALVGAEGAGGNSKQFTVGFYSRIERDKGIYDFIDVVRLAHSRNPRIVGVVYGAGAEAAEVERLISMPPWNEYLSFGGWLSGSDKAERLSRLDALAFLSHYEGYPNAVLEAMASGVPVVSTNVSSIEDLSNEGQNCIVVDVGDVKSAADAVELLADNEALRYGMRMSALSRLVSTNTLKHAVTKLLGD